jgi:hypothetical protein
VGVTIAIVTLTLCATEELWPETAECLHLVGISGAAEPP